MGIPRPKLSEDQAKRLIQILWDNKGEKGATEIAEGMGIGMNSVTSMAKRLQKAGINVEIRKRQSSSFYKGIIENWKREQGL